MAKKFNKASLLPKTSKKFRLQKGDDVIVIAGRSKGRSGKIKKMLTSKDRVLVEGVNMIQRRIKPNAAAPEGIIEKETSIHISNVAYKDFKAGKATRVGYRITKDGTKERFAKLSKETIIANGLKKKSS